MSGYLQSRAARSRTREERTEHTYSKVSCVVQYLGTGHLLRGGGGGGGGGGLQNRRWGGGHVKFYPYEKGKWYLF